MKRTVSIMTGLHGFHCNFWLLRQQRPSDRHLLDNDPAFSLNPAWISNYIHYKVWGEITYPCLNFNGATVVTLNWACDYLSMLGLKLNHVSKRGYWCFEYICHFGMIYSTLLFNRYRPIFVVQLDQFGTPTKQYSDEKADQFQISISKSTHVKKIYFRFHERQTVGRTFVWTV